MDKTSTFDPAAELTAAAQSRDGSHTGTQLARQVRAGQALRVRRGVYVDPEQWIEAMPWHRYQIAVAATALATDPIFCRETALLLHQVPLVRTPRGVLARTTRMNGTGRVPAPSLTGPLGAEEFRRLYRQQHPTMSDFPANRLRSVPTQLLYPPLSGGLSRPAALEGVRQGSLPLHEVRIEPAHRLRVRGPGAYRVEPLELALIDTVSRMPFAEAVVALDWIKANREVHLQPWLRYLSSGTKRGRWERAWDFATPHSESPGESRSRALMDELGFVIPAQQSVIETDSGAFRVDFCWAEDRVIGEFDGRVKYFDEATLNGRDPKEVLYQEKHREDALRRAGWIVIRWTWAVLNAPAGFAAYLKNAGVSLLR